MDTRQTEQVWRDRRDSNDSAFSEDFSDIDQANGIGVTRHSNGKKVFTRRRRHRRWQGEGSVKGQPKLGRRVVFDVVFG